MLPTDLFQVKLKIQQTFYIIDLASSSTPFSSFSPSSFSPSSFSPSSFYLLQIYRLFFGIALCKTNHGDDEKHTHVRMKYTSFL
jgi:hypothetical protein